MKAKTYILIAILIALTLLSGYLYIDRQRDNERLTTAMVSLQAANTKKSLSYMTEIAGYETRVYEQSRIILTQREAIKTGVIDKDRYKALYLKEISHVVDLTAQIKILSDSFATVSVNPIDISNPKLGLSELLPTIPVMPLPFTFERKNDYLNLSGGFKIDGSMYFSLYMPLELDLTIGIKKRTQLPTVSAFSTSPYVGDIRVRSIEVIENKHFWNSTLFKVGVGFIGGSYLTYKIVK